MHAAKKMAVKDSDEREKHRSIKSPEMGLDVYVSVFVCMWECVCVCV